MEPQNREPLERMTELEWMRCTRIVWRPGLRGRRTLSPFLCCVVWSSFSLGLASQEMNTWGQNKGDVCLTGAQPSWGGGGKSPGDHEAGGQLGHGHGKSPHSPLLQRLTLPQSSLKMGP